MLHDARARNNVLHDARARATVPMRLFIAVALVHAAAGCSNWMMQNDYHISGRTMDEPVSK